MVVADEWWNTLHKFRLVIINSLDIPTQKYSTSAYINVAEESTSSFGRLFRSLVSRYLAIVEPSDYNLLPSRHSTPGISSIA